MRNPFKRDTDDPLMRLFLDKYRLNLLSIPRENASVGDVYITDEKDSKFASPPGNIKYLLDPPFDFSKIQVTAGETLSDISGTTSGSISAQFGLQFLENFLNALAPIVGIGAKIRANYEANSVEAIKFRFSSPTRNYITNPFLLNVKLQRHKIAEVRKQQFLKRRTRNRAWLTYAASF